MPGRTPFASAGPVTEPISGSVPGSGASAAGAACSRGRRRSAARRSKAGMTIAAITGTYVLHEHAFPCQTGTNVRLFPGWAMRDDQPGCAPVNRSVALAAAQEPGASGERARRSRGALHDSSGRPGPEGQRERAVAELAPGVVADSRLGAL